VLSWASLAAATVTFGARDVRTIFHIAKSDDNNRVDYGIRLDDQCRPVGETPVYAYWHRFDPGYPRFGDLNLLDQQVYGITSQAVRTRSDTGTWVELHVAALPSLRILILVQRHGDGCVARAQIPVNSRPAFVDRVFVQLGGSPFSPVEYVTFRGVDSQTQEPVFERRHR
jgi:hypothetical protein